jgi:hypothetical protein
MKLGIDGAPPCGKTSVRKRTLGGENEGPERGVRLDVKASNWGWRTGIRKSKLEIGNWKIQIGNWKFEIGKTKSEKRKTRSEGLARDIRYHKSKSANIKSKTASLESRVPNP